MIATIWHGENETLYHVIDEYAPDEEQPAIVATVSTTPKDIKTMTLAEIKVEQTAIEKFKWTNTCYGNKQLLEQMNERLTRLHQQHERLVYGVEPLIADADRRAMYDYGVTHRDAIMRRFPNIVAHIICESLGYATPIHAASILQRAIQGDPDYCEWIDACYKCNPVKPVRDSIHRRHHHTGFMSSFKMARALVQHYLDNQREPMFASWF
jgi:hypothetical protein